MHSCKRGTKSARANRQYVYNLIIYGVIVYFLKYIYKAEAALLDLHLFRHRFGLFRRSWHSLFAVEPT